MPADAIEAYKNVVDRVDLASIEARERVTRHDVKARIEEFADLAGHEHIHKGMTSRDLTENVEQLQVRRALEFVRTRVVTALGASRRARRRIRDVGRSPVARTTCPRRRPRSASGSPMPARSSCRPTASSTTCSRAIPCGASKGRSARSRINSISSTVTSCKVEQLEQRVADHLGFGAVLTNVGQVYPRSLDMEVVAALCKRPPHRRASL